MKDSSRNGKDNRKQAVSIRMSRSDVRHIKRLAERLGARDSDVIRFAIKIMLAKLTPLQDALVRGRGLVPVFLECGPELMRHFELDAARLSGIINDGVEEERRVEPDDIQLIAMSGIQRSYLQLRVPGLRRAQGAAASHAAHGDDQNGGVSGSFYGRGGEEGDSLEQSLRRYLYDKYLYVGTAASARGAGGGDS
jgi:Arc/MetJ-type ribon-helix-helix transcriptional regulator